MGSTERRSNLFVPLVVGAVVATAFVALRVRGPSPGFAPSEFLRFVPSAENPLEGRLETAAIRYERDDGATVTLYAAVHVGDAAYYDELERRFSGCDALLYEMVAPAGEALDQIAASGSAMSAFQTFLSDTLELEFQLDGVEYEKPNFVHADLDAGTFFQLMGERGESFGSLIFRAMLEQLKRQAGGKVPATNGFTLLFAMLQDDSARAIKLLLAKDFGEIEAMIAGIEEGTPGGTVILSARNERAIEVLEEELDAGKRELGIFYGAAHMQDMERRVAALGFRKRSEEFLTAWDIRVREPVKTNRFHIPWISGRGQDDAEAESAER